MVDKELGFDGNSDLSPQYKMDLLLENQMKSNYNTTDTSSFNIGYDSTSAIAALNRIKTQEYYAKVASKATSNFAGLTESEKHEFYYTFTKMGFREALRTGKLPDGSCLEELENGKYRDRFGIVRDVHGPFWPSDYGPLHPSPVHVRPRPEKQELFSAGPEGKNNNSNMQQCQTFADSQVTKKPLRRYQIDINPKGFAVLIVIWKELLWKPNLIISAYSVMCKSMQMHDDRHKRQCPSIYYFLRGGCCVGGVGSKRAEFTFSREIPGIFHISIQFNSIQKYFIASHLQLISHQHTQYTFTVHKNIN